MSTPTSTRLQHQLRGVLVLPVLAGLSLTGAGSGSAATQDPGLTVGIPNARTYSGVVNSRLPAGPTQVIDEVRFGVIDRLEAGARFGAAIVTGEDLDPMPGNARGEADLIIGAPGTPGAQAKDVPGRVVIVYGARKGFQPRSIQVLENQAAPGDEFGAAIMLTHRRVANTRIQDLWIGAPGHDVDGKADAGAVFRYQISATGVPTYVETITQDHPLLHGEAEAGDRFGEVMSGDGVVGVPSEDVGALKDAGAVLILGIDDDSGELMDSWAFTQDTPHVEDVAEAGDRFGAALWGNVIGVPGEDIGTIRDAGAVQMNDGTFYHQNTPGIPGSAETGDRFGAALSIGFGLQYRSGPPRECTDMSSVAVGIPGEDIGAVKDAGAVVMVPTNFQPSNLIPGDEYCRPQMFAQGHGLPGKAEAGDRVGAAMGVRPGGAQQGNSGRETVLIGVPGEDIKTTIDVGRVIAGTGKSAKSYGYSGGNIRRMRFGTILPPDKWSL